MYNLETIESLQAYADRLHREIARSRSVPTAPRPTVRGLFRHAAKGRRTS